jgi:hypothetical protein
MKQERYDRETTLEERCYGIRKYPEVFPFTAY